MKRESGQTTDEILVREIARLAPPFCGWGAKRAAKTLLTETRFETLVLKMPAERAHELALLTLSKLGRMQVSSDVSVHPTLRAVVGAGTLNLNPALVDLVITENSTNECAVTITAAAKEGLIKQQTAAGAIQRVIAALLE